MSDKSHEALRVRIEAALRERCPDARVSVRPPMEDRYGGHDAMAVATWGNVEVLASGEDEQTALGEVADAVCLELREHADYPDALLARQHALLTGVANALRGDPGPLASHSHHDLAERAAAVVAEIATLRAADDPLLDGTDGAHPAWWRGHDRAAEMLTAQRDAALADAARVRAAYASDLASLAGRTTPPTEAEIRSHAPSGGWWIVTYANGSCDATVITRAGSCAWHEARGVTWWLPLTNGRPCAWPTVTT